MNIQIPDWFIEKYPNIKATIKPELPIEGGNHWFFPLSTAKEQKFYFPFEEYEMFKDIQKIIEVKTFPLAIVLLHECGGITRVEIGKDYIRGSEPTAWKNVSQVEHDYCYGCSDTKHNE